MSKPGDPLSPQMVRELRAQAGLTQEGFAGILGVRGGKSVVSAWETGASVCDGPTAELIRLKFGGSTMATHALETEMTLLWNTGPAPEKTWRQISAIPKNKIQLDAVAFSSLFPVAAVSEREHVHGFPFVKVAQSPSVYGLTASGWLGRIPEVLERSPAYLWMYKRNSVFAYRELAWEIQHINNGGNLHIRPIMASACSTVAFLSRLPKYSEIDPSTQYELTLHFGGMRGRGLVVPDPTMPIEYGFPDSPGQTWADDHFVVSTVATLDAMNVEPVKVCLELLTEMALLLRPSLVQGDRLRDLLRQFHIDDKNRGGFRNFGVVDKWRI